MANLIEYIQSQVYENSTEDISGSIMQQVLTRMASDEGVVNVHTISGQTPFADYNNAQAARDAVPAGFKKLGLIITYKLSSGWYIDEFIGSATSGWSTASNWKCLGPISVSQNASTGKTTITIGSESFDVATQPVSVSQNTQALEIGGVEQGAMGGIYENTPEWVYVVVDTDRRILIGIDKSGKVLIPKFSSPALKEYQPLEQGKGLIDSKYAESVGVFVDKEDRLEVETDSQSRILSYRDRDGYKHECKGLVVNDISAEHFSYTEDNISELISILNARHFGGGYDIRLPQIRVYSELLTVNGNDIIGLNTTKNEVACTYDVITGEERFTDDGTIAYQGNTSLYKPKKGFSINFSHKHRFGTWLVMDEYHCKGYYSDWMHLRDLVANQILEQVYASRNYENDKPYKRYNDFTNVEKAIIYDSGALCHIDGFPVELYINDTYWGLYSLNIKKARSNYLLSKNNPNHIQVEAANDVVYSDTTFANGGTGWQGIEIRNPKKDDGNASFEEGVEPNAGTTKTAWQAFMSNLSSISVSTTKSELSAFLNIDAWIDAIIFGQMLNHADCWCKNTLYTTWDREHWSPLIYDLDNTFGIASTDGDVAMPYNTDTDAVKADSYCTWLSVIKDILSDDIEARYKELRDNGIFSMLNFKQLVFGWTKKVSQSVYEDDSERWTYPSLGNSSENFIESPERVLRWLSDRLGYLDNLYNY